MPSSFRSLGAYAVLLAIAFSFPLPARAESIDEQLFLVYALEDMYRTTWPAQNRDIKCSQDVRRFLNARRIQADRLRRQIETRKRYELLARGYKDYLSLLDLAGPYQEKLERREDAYLAYIREMQRKVFAADQLSRAATAMRSLASASDAISSSFRNPFNDAFDAMGSGLFAGLGTYMMGNMLHQLRMNQLKLQAIALIKKYEAENKPRLESDIRKYDKGFFESFDKEKAKRVLRTVEMLRSLKERNGWSEREGDFDPNRPLEKWTTEDQPHNPFRAKTAALWVLQSKKINEADPKELLQLAQEVQAAIQWIPSLNLPTLLRFKADFYFLAGLLANQAARIEIGQTGFKDAQSKPAEAATFSQKMWKNYGDCEKRNAAEQAEALHQRLLAFAYGGKPRHAFALLDQTPLHQIPSGNPTFWFDVARLVSLAGDNLQKRCDKNASLKRNPQTQALLAKYKADTMYCLRLAVYTGLKKSSELEAHADLEWIRFIGENEIRSLAQQIEKNP